jgi:EF-P beta-lysylation protein EpmB
VQKTPVDSPWQRALARAARHPTELLAAVGLQDHPLAADLADTDFPLRVPQGYIARMRHGDPRDPLLLQVLPRGAESHLIPGFGPDPVGDHAATTSPGLLHKYSGRVLLMTTGACPVHCRYCFRRHYPYAENHLDEPAWQAALDYIAADTSIHEVILSGGDPLSLSNERLAAIGRRLAAIPHLRRLRIHSRMPIVLPERIDRGLLEWLAALPWQTVLVTHCNHANEIDAGVQRALQDLRQHGVTLLNQAVLLRDVNDDADALCALSETLFAAGALPYYLHLLDRVQGAAHFEVTESRGRLLMTKLQRRLPGFLVPRLVREVAGEAHKIPL